LEILDTWRH